VAPAMGAADSHFSNRERRAATSGVFRRSARAGCLPIPGTNRRVAHAMPRARTPQVRIDARNTVSGLTEISEESRFFIQQ
jgi:hypothetical protein